MFFIFCYLAADSDIALSQSMNGIYEKQPKEWLFFQGISSTFYFLSPSSWLIAFDSNPSKLFLSWILDSGCTSHMTFNQSKFKYYSSIVTVSVDFGAKSKSQIRGTRSIKFLFTVGEKSRKFTFEDAKNLPKLRFQLISISDMLRWGIQTEFDDEISWVIRQCDEKLL